MTSAEANALHNPFLHKGRFRAELQLNCAEHAPNLSLLRGTAIALTFPNQAWVDLVSSARSVTALFLDRPKAKDLSAIANLPLTNLTMSYPSHVKDWSFLRRLPTLIRLSLHNTLSLQDLELVRALSSLEVLQLSGGYSKPLRLPSLAPLADSRHLTAILLAAVHCTDWSLRPLFHLSSLRRFDCPLWWPSGEIRALTEHNKELNCNVNEPA
jgi:hypothetical protein